VEPEEGLKAADGHGHSCSIEVSIGDSGLDPCLSCVQVKTGLWIKLIKE
jgi:hypothetical protein